MLTSVNWMVTACEQVPNGLWVASMMREAYVDRDQQSVLGHERHGWGSTPHKAAFEAQQAWTLDAARYCRHLEQMEAAMRGAVSVRLR